MTNESSSLIILPRTLDMVAAGLQGNCVPTWERTMGMKYPRRVERQVVDNWQQMRPPIICLCPGLPIGTRTRQLQGPLPDWSIAKVLCGVPAVPVRRFPRLGFPQRLPGHPQLQSGRYYGPVPEKNIVGKAARVLWPFTRINALDGE